MKNTISQNSENRVESHPATPGHFETLNGNEHIPRQKASIMRSQEYPGISFATVYNTLSKLAEAGKLQELDIDPNKKRFDPCVIPHHHFYCKIAEEFLTSSRIPLS